MLRYLATLTIIALLMPPQVSAETGLMLFRREIYFPPAEILATLKADRATLEARAAKDPDRARLLNATNHYIDSQRHMGWMETYSFIPTPSPEGRLIKSGHDPLGLFDLDDDGILMHDEVRRSIEALSH